MLLVFCILHYMKYDDIYNLHCAQSRVIPPPIKDPQVTSSSLRTEQQPIWASRFRYFFSFCSYFWHPFQSEILKIYISFVVFGHHLLSESWATTNLLFEISKLFSLYDFAKNLFLHLLLDFLTILHIKIPAINPWSSFDHRYIFNKLHPSKPDLNWKWWCWSQLSRFKLAECCPGHPSHWSRLRKVSGLGVWNVPTSHKDRVYLIYSMCTMIRSIWQLHPREAYATKNIRPQFSTPIPPSEMFPWEHCLK